MSTEEINHDLFEARRLGDDNFIEFTKQRQSSSDDRFRDPITKTQLKTSSLSKTRRVQITGREVMVRANRDIFICTTSDCGTNRDLDIKAVRRYELGPVPWSIANVEGSLVKTPKSKLL